MPPCIDGMLDHSLSLEDRLTFSLRRVQYDNRTEKSNKCEAQTALEALSYLACVIPYPVNGQQFNYHDMTTVRQEALMLACMKVAIETRRLEREARAAGQKLGKPKDEDWPEKVYLLSLQLATVVKADRDAIRRDPEMEAYFRNIRAVKFVGVGSWNIISEGKRKLAGIVADGGEELLSGDEDAGRSADKRPRFEM